MKLNKEDYVSILKHYGVPIPQRNRTRKNRTYHVVDYTKTRKRAEKVLATKLCRCIKSVQKVQHPLKEPAAIAICNKSIFRNHGLKFNKFKCDKSARFIESKKTRHTLTKTRKLKFKNLLKK